MPTKEEEFKLRGFNELAGYNSRVSEGVVHTEEYSKKMKKLQKQFNKWIKEDAD